MSSALGPLPLRGCTVVDNAADDDTDIAADTAASADAATAAAASVCDPDDALRPHRLTHAHQSPLCSRHTRCHAPPAV